MYNNLKIIHKHIIIRIYALRILEVCYRGQFITRHDAIQHSCLRVILCRCAQTYFPFPTKIRLVHETRYIQTLHEMRCRIICLTLRRSAIIIVGRNRSACFAAESTRNQPSFYFCDKPGIIICTCTYIIHTCLALVISSSIAKSLC